MPELIIKDNAAKQSVLIGKIEINHYLLGIKVTLEIVVYMT